MRENPRDRFRRPVDDELGDVFMERRRE